MYRYFRKGLGEPCHAGHCSAGGKEGELAREIWDEKDVSEMILVFVEFCKGKNRVKAVGAVKGSHLTSARVAYPIDTM